MVKKYHQTRKDREHESEGMKKREGKYHQTRKDREHESEGMKKREGKYRMDEGYMGMISEDHSAPANLPQEVVHKYYRKERSLDMYELEDSIEGVDHQINESIRKLEEYPSKGMY